MKEFPRIVSDEASRATYRRGNWVWLSLLLVPLMLLGCGGGDEAATNTEAETSTSEAPPSPAKPAAENDAKPTTPKADKFEPLELLAEMEVDVVDFKAIEFAPDGRTFVTGGGTPTLWKIGVDEPLHQFEDLYPLTGLLVEANALAISDDGKLLAIAGGDGKIHLFDLPTKELKQTIEAHEEGVVSVAFSKDAQIMASSGYDGKVKTWRTDSAAPLAVIDTETQKSVFSDISPDGKTVVSAWDDVLLWNAETGEKIGPFAFAEPRAVSVRAIGFSPDGKQVVTTDMTPDFENAAMIWSADDRKPVSTLKHEFGVGSVAFSPDGKLLATADMDVTARIWDIASQKLLQTIEEENATDMVAWSPDGKLLAVITGGVVRFYGRPGAIAGLSKTAEKQPEEDSPPREADTVDAKPAEPVADEPPAVDLPEAATMEQLVAMLDMEKFPRIEGGDYQTTEKNNITYLAPLTVPEAREFYRDKLGEADWKELDQTVGQLDTDETWSRVYEKEGYLLRLYISQLSTPADGQKIMVEFLHMGNIDTRKLPAPAGGEATFETPEFTSYTTDVETDEAIDA